MAGVSKLFVCFWGEGYVLQPLVESHKMEYFSEANAYSEEEIKRVDGLLVNEFVDFTDDSVTCAVHKVWRVV